MASCPVCFSEIHAKAIKCPQCLTFIRPRASEGQFWGTCLVVGGILIGMFSYIWFLSSKTDLWLQFMDVGIFLAYLGFLVYGFGIFRSWSRVDKSSSAEETLPAGKKRCVFCASEIDARAIKCNYCFSYLRQEKGKILAAFIVVSGILIMTTAYILFLARSIQSELYMQVGLYIILGGVLSFLVLSIRQRYKGAYH